MKLLDSTSIHSTAGYAGYSTPLAAECHDGIEFAHLPQNASGGWPLTAVPVFRFKLIGPS